jgi:transcriptional regulator with GAF, ATPase, and Fis domain
MVTSKGEYLDVPLSYLTEKTEDKELSVFPSLEDYEKKYIEDVLRHTGGVLYGKNGAAKILGLKPSTLQSRMKKMGIEKTKPH